MADTPQMVFINLVTRDVARARAFYAALGFSFDERFCSPENLMVSVSETIHLMLLTPEKFAGFAPRPVAAEGTVEALICLSRNSRAAVDDLVGRALANGGTDNGRDQVQGDYMYGRSITDPDGHVLEIMWMDVDAAMRAWTQQAA